MKARIFIMFMLVAFTLGKSVIGLAAKGQLISDSPMVASDEDIERLKNDFASGKLAVNKTRLKDVRENYGDPKSYILSTYKKIVYDYNGVIKVEFSKDRFLRDWEYDSFKDPVYTDDVDDLRYDLESETDLVGDYVSYREINKTYGEPTESYETNVDGQQSIYYYGDIKMTFENYFQVTQYTIKNLGKAEDEEVLTTK